MTYVMILFMVVMGGFVAFKSFVWLPVSLGLGYAALRALANYDPRFLDVIFVSLGQTPPTPSWFKGKGMIYHA